MTIDAHATLLALIEQACAAPAREANDAERSGKTCRCFPYASQSHFLGSTEWSDVS